MDEVVEVVDAAEKTNWTLVSTQTQEAEMRKELAEQRTQCIPRND